MSLTISIDSRQVLSAEDALHALSLPPKKRFALLKDVGRYEIRLTQQRLRQQKQIDDSAFAQSKKKKTVLKGFSKGLESYVLNGAKDLVVTWRSKLTARKANVHHQGKTEIVTAKQHIDAQNKRFGQPKYDDPATEAQAKALRKLGYKQGKKRPSKAEIMTRMRQGQVGLIIRMMRDGTTKGKQSWQVVTPKREFLGSKNALIRERVKNNIRKARGY